MINLWLITDRHRCCTYIYYLPVKLTFEKIVAITVRQEEVEEEEEGGGGELRR